MATLDSDKLRRALEGKLGCYVDDKKREHIWFYLKENGVIISRTMISKGSKETLRDELLSRIGKQLGLGAGNLVKFEKCTISKEEAIQMIRLNRPTNRP
jgi:uncharacterized membrane protein YjjP (DUF1212 family)